MENFVADAIFIDAAPDRVFAALLDPTELLEWMDAEFAEVAPEKGGRFTVRRADGSSLTGTISRIDANTCIEISPYHWERGEEQRGAMTLEFLLRPHDGGLWFTVRQNGLDSESNWESFAERTRREWVEATVALKRHIEQI